jgi:ferredoxin-nitrate reductase
VVDPRPTPTARKADLHLAIRPGTNLALFNGLLRELIAHGRIDQACIDAHTVGFDQLAQTVRPYDPERVADICGVPASQVRDAARILATAERLLSTVLQGVYQSMSATAAACQVNNLNLVRGMTGRPGCGVLQMNGQPTAQNTRETGADGDLPGFRNWDNEAHVRELAELWNVDPIVIPHWAPRPTPCRSGATPSRAPSGCCGPRPPTRRCPCPSCTASAPSSPPRTCSSWSRTPS